VVGGRAVVGGRRREGGCEGLEVLVGRVEGRVVVGRPVEDPSTHKAVWKSDLAIVAVLQHWGVRPAAGAGVLYGSRD
jgi:hypothetical protein